MSSGDLTSAKKAISKAKKDGSGELNLSRLGLTKLPTEITELENLRFLDLKSNNLSEFPQEIFRLKYLKYLEISFNPIVAIPPEIGELSNLVVLSMTDLGIEELPVEICQLQNLRELFVGLNKLSRLPKGFSQLPNLQALYLHKNNFSTFPSEIAHYKTLQTLTLGSKLRRIPSRISRFKKLKRLSLTGNKLESIPSIIGSISSLDELQISGNNITEIPSEIGELEGLTQFQIYDNPLPASLLSAEKDGTNVLLAQIKSLADPNKIATLSEAKLMITGEGKVGKSCLRMALDGSLDPDRDLFHSTTWGVDCGTLFLSDEGAPNGSIQFNYWDFGGQKIYRITHQFFYSDQGLYLLVWDPRLGEEQCLVEDWLVRIAARTAGVAKVILVATHADADGGNYHPKLDLSQYDPELRALVVDQISVDSFSGKNIEALKTAIKNHVKGMPGIKSPINCDWDNARQEALDPGNSDPWMSYREFEGICAHYGIEDPQAVRSIAATFLHRLGRGVWYGIDWENDAFLRDTIVRDPSWLAMAFMEIVQHEPTKLAGGMLDHEALPDVWINHGREKDGWRVFDLDDHQRIIRMLRAQGVALPTKASDGQRSLIPQLVSSEKPALPWNSASELSHEARIIRMRTKIEPAVDGFIYRLIAGLEPYHHYLNDGRGAFWQLGMFLRDSAGRFRNDALITLKPERNFIELETTVTGEEPGLLMQQIDASITECLKFWPGANRDDRVGCPHHFGGGWCSGHFKLSNVERWLRRNQENAICHECDHVTPPSDLIYGLRSRAQSQSKSEQLLHYLAFKEQRPAPKSVVLLPVKSNWKDIRNWEILGRTRLKAQLRSEFSGALVAEKEFTANPGLLKYLGPVAKLGALFFAATPLPLDLSPGFSESFGELSDSLDKLGDQLPDGEQNIEVESVSDDKNLALVEAFLEAIDLSPKLNGMDLERAPDGNWYWMTADEVNQHRPIQASIEAANDT